MQPQHKIAPIVSVGYDSSLISEGPFCFNAELGLMYSGKFKITSANPLMDDYKKVINDIKKDKYFKFFSIISFGIKYSF